MPEFSGFARQSRRRRPQRRVRVHVTSAPTVQADAAIADDLPPWQRPHKRRRVPVRRVRTREAAVLFPWPDAIPTDQLPEFFRPRHVRRVAPRRVRVRSWQFDTALAGSFDICSGSAVMAAVDIGTAVMTGTDEIEQGTYTATSAAVGPGAAKARRPSC